MEKKGKLKGKRESYEKDGKQWNKHEELLMMGLMGTCQIFVQVAEHMNSNAEEELHPLIYNGPGHIFTKALTQLSPSDHNMDITSVRLLVPS